MIKMESVGSRERFLIKKFLPCITGFVLVAAIFFIGAGAWAVDKEKAHAAISSLPILTPPILLVTAGILCLLVGFVGLFSVCKKETNLRNMGNALKVFLVLLALASILALVAGGFGMDYAGRLSDGYKADFYKKIEKYATTGHYEILAHVDRVQKEDACCGVINYADWRNTQYAGNRYDKVPDSCCQVEEHACGFEFELSKINQKGCFMAGVDQMNTKLKIVGIGGLVLGVFEAILWISLFCIYFKETCCPNQGKDRIEVSYRKTGESEHPSERENEGCSSDTQTKDKPSSIQAYEGPGAQESYSPSRNQGKDRIEVSYQKTGESEHPSERENEGCSSDTQTKDTPSSTQGYKGPGAQESHSPSPQDDAPSSVTPSVGKAPKRSGKRKKASRKSTSRE